MTAASGAGLVASAFLPWITMGPTPFSWDLGFSGLEATPLAAGVAVCGMAAVLGGWLRSPVPALIAGIVAAVLVLIALGDVRGLFETAWRARAGGLECEPPCVYRIGFGAVVAAALAIATAAGGAAWGVAKLRRGSPT